MPSEPPPRYKLFISYRHSDQPDFVQLLRKCFTEHYGKENVFMDSHSISKGARWEEVLEQRVRWCDAMVVVIGPQWVKLMREKALEEVDYVRMEIALGLAEKKVVIPVCIKGVEKLPEERQVHYQVRGMLEHQGVYLPKHLDSDDPIEQMIASIDRTLAGEILEKEVQKLEEIPPAAGLALGYFVNFVRPVILKLSALTEDRDQCVNEIVVTDRAKPPAVVHHFSRDPAARKDLKLHIVIPHRAALLKPKLLDPIKARLRLASIHAGPAARPFGVDAWEPAPGAFQFIDFPNTLTVVEDWVERRLPREQRDRSLPEWEQLEAEEITRFERMLEWWVLAPENGEEFRARVRIVRFTGSQAEFAWLNPLWEPAGDAQSRSMVRPAQLP